MAIERAQFADEDNKSVEMLVDGHLYYVPTDQGNRFYRDLQAWVKAGGVIDAYVAPPVDTTPTTEDRLKEVEAMQRALVKKDVVTRAEIKAEKVTGRA